MQRSRLGNFLAVVEIRTKVVSVSSFLLGTLFAMRCLSVQGIGAVHWGRALSMFLATLCVDMGTTAWNTYFDYLRGTDDPRINREPDKVLIHGGLPPAYAFWTAFWLYIAAMVGGLVLSFQVGFWILPVGAACMAVGFFYNAGPLPISHTPFGELFAGGFLGSGLFLISFGVQAAGRVGSGFKAAIGKGAALVDAGLMGAGQAGAVREGAGVLDVGLAGSGVGSVLRGKMGGSGRRPFRASSFGIPHLARGAVDTGGSRFLTLPLCRCGHPGGEQCLRCGRRSAGRAENLCRPVRQTRRGSPCSGIGPPCTPCRRCPFLDRGASGDGDVCISGFTPLYPVPVPQDA
jgi:hypothetical protein